MSRVFLLSYADAPLTAPAEPAGWRRVAVGPLAEPAEGRDLPLPDRFGRLLTEIARALAAEKAGPPHLSALTIRSPDAQALLDQDPWALELIYRESLGGNFCDMAVVSDPKAEGLAAEAVAFVPPAPEGPVYADMDAATLNFQYSARAQTPEHMDHMTAWRREGAAFREARTPIVLTHGDGPGGEIDLYPPTEPQTGSGGAPIHLFIHGGYWQALDKSDQGHLFEAMLEAGVAVALPNYDLLPKDDLTLADLSEQVRCGLEALWAAAPLYGLNRDRLTVSGHSAGGHLGAVLAATDWSARDAGLPRDAVKGAVLISGLYDLSPLVATGINHAVGMDEDLAVRESPLHMRPAHALPALVAVGGLESEEFQRQSRELAEVWGRRGAATELLILDGLNHFTALEALGDPASDLGRRAMRLIAAV
ncbi:MAG: alpha/beta hydrolase [Marivibrio sp.]|uniref:alpha/beta hydrolase n=1 Tax=Marivibrio sp. TaxID=2039719 RepID=UPI0032EEEF73